MRDAITWDENQPPPNQQQQVPPRGGARAERQEQGADSFFRMPDRLAADWTFVAPLGTGGQARVIQVRSRRQPEILRVLKIYNPGSQPRPEVIDSYSRLDPQHVVRIYDSGAIDDQHYEIMEYLSGGSLRQLIDREGRRLPPERVRQVLEQLAAAVTHIHGSEGERGGVAIAHRDLKPGNVLVRREGPLDLVLADFGVAATMNALSERISTGGRTVHYAPRETLWHRVSREADWWSLGIMVVEMLNGRHPLSWPHSGELMDDREVVRILTTEPADNLVEGITDPGWRLLCRGLLRHDRAHRWTGSEVRRWLAGEREPTLTVRDEVRRNQPRVVLAGVEIDSTDPLHVARILSERWEAARADFGRGRIAAWASRDPLFPDIPERLSQIGGAFEANEYRRSDADQGLDEGLFRTLIVLAPSMQPRLMGYALTNRGLDELAIAAINGDQRARDAVRLLFERQLFEIYAAETGEASYRILQAQWRQEVDRFIQMAAFLPEEALPNVEHRVDMAVALALRGSMAGAELWLDERRSRAAEQFRRVSSSPAWLTRLRRFVPGAGAGQLVVLDVALEHIGGIRAAEAALRAARPLAERVRDGLGLVLRAVLIVAVIVVAGLIVVPVYRSWEGSRDTARASQVVSRISFGRSVDPASQWLIDPVQGNPPQVRGNGFALVADVVNARAGSDRVEFVLTRQNRPLQTSAQVATSPVGRVNASFANVAPGDYIIQTKINGTPGFSASVRVVAP